MDSGSSLSVAVRQMRPPVVRSKLAITVAQLLTLTGGTPLEVLDEIAIIELRDGRIASSKARVLRCFDPDGQAR